MRAPRVCLSQLVQKRYKTRSAKIGTPKLIKHKYSRVGEIDREIVTSVAFWVTETKKLPPDIQRPYIRDKMCA